MQIYHGSNVIVNKPKNYYGWILRWALAKKNKHVVNVYSYKENNKLNCLIFKEMSDE